MIWPARGSAKHEVLQQVFDVLKQDNAWALAPKAEAGAIWAKEMNIPADLAERIGENNAVPTAAVSPSDIAEIGRIADWYAEQRIIPARPDVAAGTVTLR